MEHPNLSASLKMSIAMLTGILVESAFVVGIAMAQTGIGPPLQAVPFFVLNAVYAVVFLPLLWWKHTAGYVGAIGVSAFSILILVLVFTGQFGEFVPANPLGPITLLVLALILIISTVKAWKAESRERAS